ncbi:uncharacterized protein [Euwallacea similis]|uniref:uncharacterized protein n=1 Tax=Euwallacea similis TaxID=1736056 RepID=UPI00344C2918
MSNNKLISASALLVCFAYMVCADTPNGGAHLMKQPSKEFVEQCEKEIGVTLQDLHNSNEDNEKKMCFHRCLATKDGYISADGVVNIERIKEYLASNPEKPNNIDAITSCLETVGRVSSCQDMVKMKNCFKP